MVENFDTIDFFLDFPFLLIKLNENNKLNSIPDCNSQKEERRPPGINNKKYLHYTK